MRINQNISISFIIVTALLSGCSIPFGFNLDDAKSDIAEEIYHDYLMKNFLSYSKEYNSDGKNVVINPLSVSVDYSVIDTCKGLFSISKDDVTKKENATDLSYYAMSTNEEIDKTAYFACIDHYLSATELDAETLNILINDPDYSRMKLYPDFDNKIKDIKSDEKITLKETVELLSIMAKHIREEDKHNYNAKVESL